MASLTLQNLISDKIVNQTNIKLRRFFQNVPNWTKTALQAKNITLLYTKKQFFWKAKSILIDLSIWRKDWQGLKNVPLCAQNWSWNSLKIWKVKGKAVTIFESPLYQQLPHRWTQQAKANFKFQKWWQCLLPVYFWKIIVLEIIFGYWIASVNSIGTGTSPKVTV